MNIKVKAMLSMCLTKNHIMKTHWGSRGTAPLILNLYKRLRWVISFITQPFYLWYSMDRKKNGLQSRSGRGGEGKKFSSLPLPRIEPLSSSP
jgi:hypothetical protein